MTGQVCTCAIVAAGTKWEMRVLARDCPTHRDRTEQPTLRVITGAR